MKTKSDNFNAQGKILLFANNVPQNIKDSVFNSLKSLKVDFKISKNNSDLISLGNEYSNSLTIKKQIGIIVENDYSIKYDIDFDSINFNPCTCNVCNVGMVDSKRNLALVGNITKYSAQSIDNITGIGCVKSDFPKRKEDTPFGDFVLSGLGLPPISIACPNKCCCCNNITSKISLYQTSIIDNRMSLFDLLESIYWAKNANIDVLIVPFSYKFTKEIDSIFTKVFDDIKGNKLLLVSGFNGRNDIYPAKFSATSNNILSISNKNQNNSPDISRLVTFTQRLFSTDLQTVNKNNLKTLLK